MANRSLRGTHTRNSWGYFESGDAWAALTFSVQSGNMYSILTNNSSGAAQLDLYKVEFSASTAARWDVSIVQTISATTPITGGEMDISALQTDKGQPPGVLSAASAIVASHVIHVHTRSDNPQHGTVELMTNGPFATLPPGWSVVVSAAVNNPTELSTTFWYLQIIDLTAPAM